MTDALPPYPTPPERPGPGAGRSGGSARPASLARRVLPAVAVLGAAGGLLALLDHPAGTEVAADAGAGATTPAPSQATTPTTTLPGGASGPARSTTTTVPATPTCSGPTVTGDSVSTRYGPVQVKITVDGDGKVCASHATSAPNGDRRSQAINSRAVPLLDEKAVTAGTASFNGVSGATITSNAYKKSLQSALDKA